MKTLLVITTPQIFPHEGEVITSLFREGMERLHIRKPACSAAELNALLDDIPQEFYPRIVLHDCFHIASELGLGGIHLNSRNSLPPPSFVGSISRSCHSLQEVADESRNYTYLLLSPVFDSISKEGYRQAFSAAELTAAATLGIISPKVFALGGIDASTLPSLDGLPFGGVAVLGALWGKEPSLEQTNNIIRHFKLLRYVLRQPSDRSQVHL